MMLTIRDHISDVPDGGGTHDLKRTQQKRDNQKRIWLHSYFLLFLIKGEKILKEFLWRGGQASLRLWKQPLIRGCNHTDAINNYVIARHLKKVVKKVGHSQFYLDDKRKRTGCGCGRLRQWFSPQFLQLTWVTVVTDLRRGVIGLVKG